MGRYDLKGDKLAFDQIVATRMNCLQGIGLEKAFLEALGRARNWRITGQRLDLFDEAGKLLARLEARNMK
jgi:heat shock protein HslJ